MGKIKCLNCGAELTMISNAACPACGVRLSHVKISFLAYLGPEDSLTGYQRSYKLVLLKSIFEEYLVNKSLSIRPVVGRFKDYYCQRKLNGLAVDKDVDSRIANIDESTLEDVFSVIKMNPYNAIQKQGFLKIDEMNGCFVLQRGIDDLSENEIQNLLELLEAKLAFYYRKIGSEPLRAEKAAAPTNEEPAEAKELKAAVEETEAGDHAGHIPAEESAVVLIPESLSLEELNLSNRAYNSLRRNGISSISEMMEAIASGEIRKFKNIGAMTVAELENIVSRLQDGSFSSNAATGVNEAENPDAVEVPKTDELIERVYYENGFNLFRQYCSEHGMSRISDLAGFDFDQLYAENGFGAAKVERAEQRYRDFLQGIAPQTVVQTANADVPANNAFTSIHESNLDLPIGMLRYFGYTPKAIHSLSEAGITSLRELQDAGNNSVVRIVGKQKGAELREVLRSFSISLQEIGAKILDDCSSDRNFEIYIQRSNGDSLQAVADSFGLTRERIRQICAKFERRLLPVMQTIAESILAGNDSAYFTEEQILDVFDDDNYDKIIIAVLKNCPEYTYLDFAKVFVRNSEYPDAESVLEKLAEEIVGDGIDLFEKFEEIEEMLSNSGYGFVTADGFLDLLIKYNYKFYGDYVIRTRKSYGLLCAEIVADEFPNGFHVSDEEEIAQLRRALSAKYGNLDVPENNRSFVNRIVAFLVQSGRSTYIAPKNIIVDDSVIQDIKAYIDNAQQQDIYYNQIFAEYEGILMMTSNIDNAGFLHGVLAWKYPNEYSYSRDFLRKPDAAETATLAEQIRDVLAEAGHALSKKEIMGHFPGLTDAMFNNAFYSVPWLFQWEYGIFNCGENLSISPEDSEALRKMLEKTLEENDGYCSQELFYRCALEHVPELCRRNDVTSAQNVFYIASYLFGGLFEFSRPHVAVKGRFKELDVKTIALELLGCPSILNADDYYKLARKFEWSDVTASLVFSSIEKEYVRLAKNLYQKAENFSLSEEDKDYIAELLSWSDADEWYLPLQRFADSEDYMPSGRQINEFIMNSIVTKYSFGWHVVTPQAKDRRYEKGILVRDEKEIAAYDQLVAQVLAEAGIHALTASRMLSFLQIHQLTYKTVPKELEVSEYFIVSDDQFTLA